MKILFNETIQKSNVFSGNYIIFKKDNPDVAIYIGESYSVLERLKRHRSSLRSKGLFNKKPIGFEYKDDEVYAIVTNIGADSDSRLLQELEQHKVHQNTLLVSEPYRGSPSVPCELISPSEEVCRFDSIEEASKKTGLTRGSIGRVLEKDVLVSGWRKVGTKLLPKFRVTHPVHGQKDVWHIPTFCKLHNIRERSFRRVFSYGDGKSTRGWKLSEK